MLTGEAELYWSPSRRSPEQPLICRSFPASSIYEVQIVIHICPIVCIVGSKFCEAEFNKAHAIALAHGKQGYTVEGAAAMDCTQRLAKITGKAVRSFVENR